MPRSSDTRARAAAVLALVMAAACGGDDAAPPPQPPPPDAGRPDAASPDTQMPPDKTPPTLMRRVPQEGEDNVWVGAPIVLVFSEPLAPSTVNDAAVTLQSTAGPVAKRVMLSDDGREIRLEIESPHIGPTELTAIVSTTLTDVAGNAFAGTSWSWSVPLWQRPGGGPVATAPGPLRPAMALDSAQVPIVAWQDSTAGMGAIRVAKVVDGQWQRLGDGIEIQSAVTPSSPRVAVTELDEPVVVWQETSPAEKHVYAARFRGERWERLGTGPVDGGAGTEAIEPVVAIDTRGRPVVAFIQNKTKVELRVWESDRWSPLVPAWDAGAALSDLAMALDETLPVLAVAAATARSTDVRVVRWPNFGDAWQPVGKSLDRAADHAATRPSLVVRNAAIGVAWQENDGFSDNVYAARYDETKDVWALFGAALDIEFDAAAFAPSLAFTREGKPVAAWSEVHADGAHTYVARFNGARWEVPGAGLDGEGSRQSTSASLLVDRASNPVLVWEEQIGAEAGAMTQLSARRYNGGSALRFGLEARRPPPCSFPLEGAPDFPRTLTATKCYADVARRVPAPGLIPYDINSPLWSDGAIKRRFIILPQGANITYSEKWAWELPVGAILVKEFLFEREPGNPATIYPMETRFIVKRCESGACRAAWEGYSYQWNDSGTEGTLLDNTNASLFKDWPSGARMHRHSYPGRSECTQCHVNVAGGILGLQTPQMNRNFDYGGVVDNQLRALFHAGVFGNVSMDGGVMPDSGPSTDAGRVDGGPDGGAASTDGAAPMDAPWSTDGAPPPGNDFPFGSLDTLPRFPTPSDAAHTLTERVRSYFHSNCSHCHRPDGRWPVIDFTYDAPLVSAKLPNSNICNELTPGDPDISRLYIKDSARLGSLPPNFFGLPMPPLASLLPDQRQLPTLRAWIEQMTSCP